MKQIYLKTYRYLAFLLVGGLTLAIVTFFAMFTFFMFNSSWVAPTFLSATSDRMLTFSSAYQQASQNVAVLEAQLASSQSALGVAEKSVTEFRNLASNLRGTENTLNTLANEKRSNIAKSGNIVANNGYNVESLKAGLITIDEYDGHRMAVQGFSNSITDSSVSLKAAQVGSATSNAQAHVQMLQAQADVVKARAEIAASSTSLINARNQLTRLQNSAYYQAFKGNGANLAFIPYENISGVKPGMPVYDCYALIIFCSQVGTVTNILNDEQSVEFPIFNVRFSRSLRGTFVTMNITQGNENSMHSKLFFFGRPPLFI